MEDKQSISYHVEAWDVLQHLFRTKEINDHTLHFVATFSGFLDVDHLKEAVDLSISAFPLLRCRFDQSGKRAVWHDCGYTADDMVTLIETAQDDQNVRNPIYEAIDAAAGPQVKFQIIRNEHQDTLSILMNHMLCDAAGFKDYLYLLSEIYENCRVNPDYQPRHSGSRRFDQITKPFSFRKKLGIMLSSNKMSNHDTTLFDLTGDLQHPFIEQRQIPREIFGQLKAYAKKHGATINDLILSAYIRQLYCLFGHVIHLPNTVDLRKYLADRKADGICNLVTNLTCDIGPDLGATFEQTLGKVKRAMDSEKSSTACLKSITILEKTFDFFPYKLAERIINKIFTNAPISFTNIGILDKTRLVFGDIEMLDAYMTGSIKFVPYIQLAVSTFDNQPMLSINLYGTEEDRGAIGRFLEGLIQELESVL